MGASSPSDRNPDHPTLFNQPDPSVPTQPSVAPPFADTAEHQPSQEFVDGLNDVAAGSLLTTEQVYALMRGDVEGAQNTPRLDATKRPVQRGHQGTANAAAIASWDEGVPLASPKPWSEKQPLLPEKQTLTNRASNAWKEWDGQ